MDLPMFYSPGLSSGSLHLNREESHHSVKVLRMKPGDHFFVTDGLGLLAEAEITLDNPAQCEFRLIKMNDHYGKRDFHLHIAIAPAKNNDRMEWFLEKATEVGIDEVSLLLCEHSERRIVNMDRFKRILVPAMKQSFQAYLPVIHPLVPFDQFVTRSYEAGKMIAYMDEPPAPDLAGFVNKGENVLILIGPEGDFSKKEITLAKENGFNPISLGKTRLRTETAGLVACCLIHGINL
jgi:16S rRNA (uracil1498-N3)-methyltransferase